MTDTITKVIAMAEAGREFAQRQPQDEFQRGRISGFNAIISALKHYRQEPAK